MKKLTLFAFALFLMSCNTGLSQSASKLNAQKQAIQEQAIVGTIVETSLGETNKVHRLNNLFFAGQFTQADIEKLKEAKIERVITLRMDKELDWDEKAAIESAGLTFARFPFASPGGLTDEVFDKVRESLKDKSQTTLLHCGTANRAGGVWLPYRVLDEGVDLETALAESKQIGLKSPFIKEKALDYIKRHQETPAMAGEKSVKPGFNKNFVDPELDVDSYVKRFEIESREVFITRERILSECEIEKGDTVADVGAGTGLFSRMFSIQVGDEGWVYSVDIAPRFIEYINKENAKFRLSNITGVLCAENSVNLPPKSSDVVFVCDTYHHFEYPKSTLASIRRALKDDGHLIVIDFERIEGKTRKFLMGHVRAGKEVFLAEILEAGFTLVEEKKIDGFQENYFLKFKKN